MLFFVWTFASVLYHGKWKEGVEFAREHSKLGVRFVPEISGFSESKSDEDLAKEVTEFASLGRYHVWVLSETCNLFESKSRFPFSPSFGLVSAFDFYFIESKAKAVVYKRDKTNLLYHSVFMVNHTGAAQLHRMEAPQETRNSRGRSGFSFW